MIPASPSDVYTLQSSWQQELGQARLTPAQLAQRLALPEALIQQMAGGDQLFPIRVTESYLQRIEIGNLQDPLLQQILPSRHELESHSGYCEDPTGECSAMQSPGLLQKYHGRALLVTTAACAIHCRYCFRRNYPYQQHSLNFTQHESFDWIAAEPDLEEIILSGGDPLTLSDHRIDRLLTALESIPHIKTVRFHTRIPVVLPARISEALLQRLQQSPLRTVIVIHCNHPNEIDSAVTDALTSLHQIGVTLLNQSVLLNGINSSVETLTELSHTLFRAHVLPYYIHLLDRVTGSQHFDMPEREALSLHRQLRQRLPGYLVPRLVREIEGEPNKTPIG